MFYAVININYLKQKYGFRVFSKSLSHHEVQYSNPFYCVLKKEKYNNIVSEKPDIQIRKLRTSRPLVCYWWCPFKIVIDLGDDGLWYQWHVNMKTMNKFNTKKCSQHMYHPIKVMDEIQSLPYHYIPKDMKKEFWWYGMCNISSSVAANLVSTISDFWWLPSQVK